MQASEAHNQNPVDAHEFGALATRLTEALGRARAAIAPHAAQLPDAALAEIDALLAEFARRRVRIAIYGEVKAGKSTLLNAIAGAALSPVAFEPLTSFPVRVTYGAETAWRVGDQRLDSVAAVEAVMRQTVHQASEVVVETDCDLLQLGGQVDLLDTPGVGSVAALDSVSAETLRSLDAVVLVVRYPALFTEYTRNLMDHLQSDIGKLFVVWNLDAACVELTAAERTRHADSLRADVAGAHELLLVDARAGFRAMEAGDGSAAVASGLSALIAALRRFAMSGGREVAALREAAKRARQQMDQVQRVLSDRHVALQVALADARARLQTVQSAADAESAAERTRFADFEAAVARIGQDRATGSAKLAAELRRDLKTARRQWAGDADFEALAEATTAAVSRYADAVATSVRAAHDALRAETAGFGAALASAPRERIEPTLGELTPAERRQRALAGRWQWLRRRLWHRWYLPGLAALQGAGIDGDLSTQSAWWDAACASARAAAQATLDAQLAQIAQRTQSEQDAIKAETNFVANGSEFDQLAEHLPIVAKEAQTAIDVGNGARALLSTEASG